MPIKFATVEAIKLLNINEKVPQNNQICDQEWLNNVNYGNNDDNSINVIRSNQDDNLILTCKAYGGM